MALYYNLVFGLLVIEMGFFTILSLPFPRAIRRSVLATASAPFRSEQFQIAIKCILGFVLVLFIDSINRVYSVTAELHSSTNSGGLQGTIMNDRSEIQARRFYAQRNMYLCGFTLFLTLILSRTYSLVGELISTKDKLDNLKAKGGESNPEIEKLKKELADKDEDLQILKDQAKSLSSHYDEVSDSKVKSRKS
ncbi:putative endoplasmic reticulum transmembrane protein [Scheffersomyces amazonensis]|uniref:putative endoplasmic reticulum transmembrane protein n=1 Tax=Scheffersomyces amazonensis TaxID=1078765 RepID=UPI00315CC9C5